MTDPSEKHREGKSAGDGLGAGCRASMYLIAAGVIVLLYQIYYWLRYGEWFGMPVLKIFQYFDDGRGFDLWIQNPTSWVGVNKIIWAFMKRPSSLFLFIVSFIVFYISLKYEEWRGCP